MRTSTFGSNAHPVSYTELLTTPSLANKIPDEQKPNFDVMSDGIVFIDTTKVINKVASRSISHFIIMDRNNDPIVGYTPPKIPIADGMLILAVNRLIGNSTQINFGNKYSSIMATSMNNTVMYFAPLNEIVIDKQYRYVYDQQTKDSAYGKDMFREICTIASINQKYWDYTVGQENPTAKANSDWFNAKRDRITKFLNGINDPESEISFVIGQFDNN